jgi:hypothetical protein
MGSCAAFGGIPKANPNPTGGRVRVRYDQGQTDHQHPRLPADSGGHDRCAGPLPYLRQPAGTGQARVGRRRSTAKPSTTVAIVGRSTTRASSPRPSTTMAPATAGACSNWAAKARSPTTPAPPSSGTAAPLGRWNPGMAAWAVPNPTSGMAGGFYKALSMPANPLKLAAGGRRRAQRRAWRSASPTGPRRAPPRQARDDHPGRSGEMIMNEMQLLTWVRGTGLDLAVGIFLLGVRLASDRDLQPGPQEGPVGGASGRRRLGLEHHPAAFRSARRHAEKIADELHRRLCLHIGLAICVFLFAPHIKLIRASPVCPGPACHRSSSTWSP